MTPPSVDGTPPELWSGRTASENVDNPDNPDGSET